MKILSQKKWDEVINVIKFLYQGQKLMADQINVLTNQVAALNAKVLPDGTQTITEFSGVSSGNGAIHREDFTSTGPKGKDIG